MLKCNSKNPKFKNLTIGKDYEGVIEGDFAEVVNDTGVKARYNKKYFSNVPTMPPPPPRPVIRNLDLQDIIDRFHIGGYSEENDNNSAGNVEISYSGRNTFRIYINRVSNSCGVLEIDGMNEIASTVELILREINNSTTEITSVTNSELFDSLIYRALMSVYEELDHPFYMLTTDHPDRDIFAIFNSRFNNNSSSVKTSASMNNNSGNEIAVWVIDTESFFS